MDSALPMPMPGIGTGVDRRRLVYLVLAGAAGAAFTGAGVPVSRAPGGLSTLDSVQRMVANIADAYDSVGPVKVASYVPRLEQMLTGLLVDRSLPPRQAHDAKVAYARLLVMSTTADTEIGHYAKAARTGEFAASLAMEVGDAQTAGRAWSEVATALRHGGREHAALVAARRGRSHAGDSPAGVTALLELATAAAAIGRADTVLDAVSAAEEMHARLPVTAWGTAGAYSLDTYHPADVKALAGDALVKVGMYAEAAPRLDEAANLYAGTGSMMVVFVRLSQARGLLGVGNVDGAHALAATAVASAETRPAAWVVQYVRQMDAQSGGAFADLVAQTSRWGLAAAA